MPNDLKIYNIIPVDFLLLKKLKLKIQQVFDQIIFSLNTISAVQWVTASLSESFIAFYSDGSTKQNIRCQAGGSKGDARDSFNFIQFLGNLAKSYVVAPCRVDASPRGNTGSATGSVKFSSFSCSFLGIFGRIVGWCPLPPQLAPSYLRLWKIFDSPAF